MISISKTDYNEYDLHTRAIRFTFANGVTASVVFGSGTYSDNYNSFFTGKFTEEPYAVEFAALYEGEFITRKIFPGPIDDVIGYVDINVLPDFLAACRDYKPS